MKRIVLSVAASCFLICFISAQTSGTFQTLKERYKDYFTVGVAISPMALRSDEKQLIESQFSGITAENVMKMGPIHPQESRFNWGPADSIVAFAIRNQLRMRGHTLVWHSQTPKWLFETNDGKQVDKETLLQRIHDHIDSVAGRYKGKIYAWDVVNEAISDRGDEFYRSSLFYQICGEEYIEKSFKWAHDADPNALLFYNDYNEIDPVKRKKIIEMVTRLRAKGIPIHGVGLQAHWSIFAPSEEVLEKTLQDFSSLNVPLHITELDISVFKKEGRRDRIPSDSLAFYTSEREEMQITMYQRIFAAFRKYRSSIRSVTFWNISDRRSWLDNFPVVGRKDYPLLFDASLQNKKAFYKVINF